ncbi:histidine--tRNA ligase, putative [Plasmodium malariae]|uniref:histidine--tRNA ligase n=1 Tax=Plasmodium malariae TaxID=5858 RepID=A0A1A8W7S7_PLAMA|nr:histidine--tRNA ligase, putative [Plasmodium malariae]
MSISVYKNKIFNTRDVLEVSIYGRNLKLEPSSFKDCVYKLNDNKINIQELEKVDGSHGVVTEVCSKDKEKNEEVRGVKMMNSLCYNMDELKCLYFFFLINILRFKNNLDINLIRNVCSSINNTTYCSSNIIFKENDMYSVTLKKFFISNLKQCGKVEYNMSHFKSSINVVIEKCSMLFLNTHKTYSLCKYLTCCLCNILELFNINCDVLFKNTFNNNVNNSNIHSINDIISKIKWMIHDSKIEKDKELSKNFSSNIMLFVYAQSKLTDDCNYIMTLINQNFKNSLDDNKHEYTEEMNSISIYINILCRGINENLYILTKNILDIATKIVPLFVNNLHDFITSNEVITNDHADLKKPPTSGFVVVYNDNNCNNNDRGNNSNSGNNTMVGVNSLKIYLTELYEEKYLRSVEKKFVNISYSNEFHKLKDMNIVFNELLILLTDIIMHMNVLYDIKAYNKALAHILKNKKVSGCVHNIGIGCLEFKNFLYSLISPNGKSKLNIYNEKDKLVLMKDNKIVSNHLFNILSEHFIPYKFVDDISEILIQKNINFNLKVPKGAKDFTGEDMQLRNIFFDFIKRKFLIHGAVEIDTPIFELKETLMDKYGEDSKLIFDLKDQGGENLSLRYDLTVPLYRFVNTNNVNALKRFHIGKVYRRDEPSMNRGRFREFYQCDFDIVGKYDTLRTDFHILFIFWDILNNLKNVIGNFNCKVNHRKILEYMLLSCNIHKDKVKTISSSIDKLDKITFQQFRDELLNEKGIPVESVDKIEAYISKTLSLSPFLVIEFLRNDLNESTFDQCYKNEINVVINHLENIFELLKRFNMINHFTLDLSLARGLDYYTGIIFEFVLLSETGLGSIAAGGRYDYLIRNRRKEYIPSVGASIGIERIIAIAEDKVKEKILTPEEANSRNDSSHCKGTAQNKDTLNEGISGTNNNSMICNVVTTSSSSSKYKLKDNSIEVLICHAKKDSFTETIELCKKLWDQNICTEFIYVQDQKIQKQLIYALEKQIPLVVIIGDEIEKGIIKLRELTLDKDRSFGEKEISLNDCVNEVKNYFKHNLTWKQNVMNILFERTKE